jgi:superfamily II DNA or RNA helicase
MVCETYVSSSSDVESIAPNIEEIFVRRMKVHFGEWRLRGLHEEGLRRFVEEIVNKGECKKIVQMPTGAGKSYLLALLVLATVFLRGRIREGMNRNIILVLAPLTRIKIQLFKPLIVASGLYSDCDAYTFPVGCVSSDSDALRQIKLKLPAISHNCRVFVTPRSDAVLWISSRKMPNAKSVSEALEMISSNKFEGEVLVSVLCPHALGVAQEREKATQILENLKERVLGVFIDEAHVMLDVEGKLGGLMHEIIKSAPVALGFTATPVKESCKAITGKSCRESFLHGRPVYSSNLMTNDFSGAKDPILVAKPVALFFRTKLILREPLRFKDEEEIIWKKMCSQRVEKYAEKMFEYFEKHFGKDAGRAKALILAPNTGEAEIWYSVLKGKYHNKVKKILIAHSNREDAQEQIEKFLDSTEGVLIAVDMVKIGFDDPNLDALVIARPISSEVGYVQMRGRVLRFPKDPSRPKVIHGALILHLAAKEIMEREEKIKRVEEGEFTKADVQKALSGFGSAEGVIQAERVIVELLTDQTLDKYFKEQRGKDLNQQLIEACYWNKINVVDQLLGMGANINAQDSSGKTPLHHAVINNHQSLVEFLLKRGADPNIKDHQGKTPLFYAVENNWPTLIAILLQHGSDLNLRDAQGRTPLHYAVETGRLKIIKELIEMGAKLNIRDIKGETPLDLARKKGRKNIINFLKRRIKPKQNLEIKEPSTQAPFRDFRIVKEHSRTIHTNNQKFSIPPLLRIQVANSSTSLDEICMIYIIDGKRKHFLLIWSMEATGRTLIKESVGIDALRENLKNRLLSYLDEYAFERFFAVLMKEIDNLLKKEREK